MESGSSVTPPGGRHGRPPLPSAPGSLGQDAPCRPSEIRAALRSVPGWGRLAARGRASRCHRPNPRHRAELETPGVGREEGTGEPRAPQQPSPSPALFSRSPPLSPLTAVPPGLGVADAGTEHSAAPHRDPQRGLLTPDTAPRTRPRVGRGDNPAPHPSACGAQLHPDSTGTPRPPSPLPVTPPVPPCRRAAALRRGTALRRRRRPRTEPTAPAGPRYRHQYRPWRSGGGGSARPRAGTGTGTGPAVPPPANGPARPARAPAATCTAPAPPPGSAPGTGTGNGTEHRFPGMAPGIIPWKRHRHPSIALGGGTGRHPFETVSAPEPAPGSAHRDHGRDPGTGHHPEGCTPPPPSAVPPRRPLPRRPRPAAVPRQRRQHRTRYGRRRRDPAGSPPALEPSPRRGRAVQPRPPVSVRCVPPPPRSRCGGSASTSVQGPPTAGTAPGAVAAELGEPQEGIGASDPGTDRYGTGTPGGGHSCVSRVGGRSQRPELGGSGTRQWGRGGGAGCGRTSLSRCPLPSPPPAECPHSAATNGGYSRKENGGFFCP